MLKGLFSFIAAPALFVSEIISVFSLQPIPSYIMSPPPMNRIAIKKYSIFFKLSPLTDIVITTTSSGGLLSALQRAFVTARPKRRVSQALLLVRL